MDTNPQPRTTTAFHVQSMASFGLSLTAVTAGIVYLPVGAWIRAFLAVGLLYVVTSAFTLAKCVRDQQDAGSVTRRVDQARMDKLLAEHDPYHVPGA
ncbi:YiaA/YiaB family inner membrane protein [Actinoplanes sp. NPDC051475]|uniref:YiaA/YiaB family inner membrane protein n=1 Tax=Actinoplanes sp. NPDC051475 TaxID=3157225 RepID=UPI00344C7DDD